MPPPGRGRVASVLDDTRQNQGPAEAPYRVLARKYRPQTFADLIGPEAMVRTLRNAIPADRVARAPG